MLLLPRTKFLKTGDLMSGLQYAIIFLAPVMTLNRFGLEKIGFIIGALLTFFIYILNHQANSGALKHYITYCFTPVYIEGNTFSSFKKKK